MTRERPSLVVLDLDGTLVRLDVDWASVRTAIASELVSRGFDQPGAGVLGTLTALRALGEHELADRCSEIARVPECRAAHSAPINHSLLRWLEREVPAAALAILTLQSRQAALECLARLGLESRVAPEDVVGRDDCPPKPAPDGLIALLRRHQLHPDQALVVGDSDVDHACGRAAGVATLDVSEIGVDWFGVRCRRGRVNA